MGKGKMELVMSDDLKFKYGDRVWRRDMNPFIMGVMLASYKDPDSGTVYCLIKSNSGNLYIAPQDAVDFVKDPLSLAVPRGVDKIND